MEVLSEHNCHGWLEGYTLTGRHGMFATYEAFAMVSASHDHPAREVAARRRGTCRGGRRSRRSTCLLTSTCWRNDHNGFSHQGPGLIQTVLTAARRRRAASTCRRTRTACSRSPTTACAVALYVNLIVIDKQPQLQWLTMAEARALRRGAAIWDWAGTDDGTRASPTSCWPAPATSSRMETVAAAASCASGCRGFRVRVVNVVDLMACSGAMTTRTAWTETLFPELFTDDVDVVFAFHGYPGAIHQLVHGRPTPTGSTSAASSRRARRRRRST